ncbi:MAG: exosortase E/protease, VPEID-CTERM system, partial [Alphaproteobacteria bacterium]|nr:exosortase E/protease, VPEID-CTERM system [Alphaproteobacteria bacterium]
QSWNALSEATFHFSAFILRLYENNVMTDAGARNIGIGDFEVNIAAACSGFEGIGLVLTFTSIYLWIFRRELRFPNVFMVLPIGVAAIWILNSVRIALLISLGAHVSPEIAVAGFHSQAGWMMFLIVTIGIMLGVHRLPYFHKTSTSAPATAPSPAVFEATALLSPFLAMTAAGIIAAAFTGAGYWLYGLRVAALSLALFAFWRFYRALDWRIGWEPIVLGCLVGAGWIATDPATGGNALGTWLATLGPLSAAAWIAMRVIGTILLVPIAEELAFRGYLHRKLIADKFETVAQGAFSWKAFVISSILFGVLHERWLSGALAGAVFAFALYRSGKLTGAITAHISANAVIAFWAIVFGQWSLL